jgi:hypothetical protein
MLTKPEFKTFCYCYLVINICVAFIDTMAEGITAINTKLQAKIVKLQEAERRETGTIEDAEEENEMKSFGMFSIIRGLFRAFASMTGGVLANKIGIEISYGILATYPLIMMLYTTLIFQEHSVSIKFFRILS